MFCSECVTIECAGCKEKDDDECTICESCACPPGCKACPDLIFCTECTTDHFKNCHPSSRAQRIIHSEAYHIAQDEKTMAGLRASIASCESCVSSLDCKACTDLNICTECIKDHLKNCKPTMSQRSVKYCAGREEHYGTSCHYQCNHICCYNSRRTKPWYFYSRTASQYCVATSGATTVTAAGHGLQGTKSERGSRVDEGRRRRGTLQETKDAPKEGIQQSRGTIKETKDASKEGIQQPPSVELPFTAFVFLQQKQNV